MNALIKVTTNEQGSQVVSAKELQEFLGVKTPLDKWMQRMSEYGFTQGIDYQQLDKVVQVGNGAKRLVLDDFALTMDCAKELSMIQRTEKGQQARRYFIECEKQLKSNPALSQLDILAQSVAILQRQEREIAEVKAVQAEQGEAIRMLDARTQTRPDYFTIVGYATLNGVNVGLKAASTAGQRASRICKERGIQTETVPDPRFGQVNMYPSTVLKEVFSMPII